MGVNCKVSCEVNLSKSNKGRRYKEDDKAVDMKIFTCEICSKSLKSKGNLIRHMNEVHHGKHRDVKHNEKMGNETVRDENKYIESVLNRVKADF